VIYTYRNIEYFIELNGTQCRFMIVTYAGAVKSLDRPTSLSIVFAVQGIGGSLMGPDPENRVGDQDIGSPGRPFSSGLQVPGESFLSWSG
jgi:hypothetical protein